MIFEVPKNLTKYIVSMCPTGIVAFTDVPEMYRADAEELQKKWAEACDKRSYPAITYDPVVTINANSGTENPKSALDEILKKYQK